MKWLLDTNVISEGVRKRPNAKVMAWTARVHELVVVIRNARHFASTGVVVYDPWNDETHRTEPA